MTTLPTTMPVEKTAAAVITDQIVKLRLIQWVDDDKDAQAIVNDDDCDLTINGVTLHAAVQMKASETGNVVRWQIGPFNPGIKVKGIEVAVLDHGAIQCWYD